MTPRQRVLTALNRCTPDRTPRGFWAEEPTWKRLFVHTGHDDKARLLDDLGIDVLDPIQPVGPEMTPEQLKAEFGDRLSFHGGIDMQHLLPHGTADDVRAEVRRYCDPIYSRLRQGTSPSRLQAWPDRQNLDGTSRP